MEKYHEIEIAGIKRKLKLCKISETEAIGAFVPFSDVELTKRCVRELINRLPEFDIVLTAESKGITFAYEMCVQTGVPYILARKQKKLYMSQPLEIPVKSITDEKQQSLFIDKDDMEKMKGKRVLILDDVISTGNSLYAMEQVANLAEAKVVGKAAILAEGDAKNLKDITYLAWIPIFKI